MPGPMRMIVVADQPSTRRSAALPTELRLAAIALLFAVGCGSKAPTPGAGAAAPTRVSENQESGNSSGSSQARSRDAASRIQFREMSDIAFTFRDGREAGRASILESIGGGTALFDFDGDGRLDLFFTGGGGFGPGDSIFGRPGALFRQTEAWAFAEATRAARLDSWPHYNHGIAVGDFDNDGFADLLITGYGGLQLYHNQGDGTFSDATNSSGLLDPLWSVSAAWCDINRDGNLDVYVTHYVDWSPENAPFCPGPSPEQRDVCPPQQFGPQPDRLYLSLGDGVFRDFSQDAGLREDGKGLGVVAADFDLDGDTDLYVGNDTELNFLYRNRGDGRFEDLALESGAGFSDRGIPDGSMGVDVADFNRDGLPDLFVANYEHESFALYRNEGQLFFQHVSEFTGIMRNTGDVVGWGTVFADFDLDGDDDVFVSNGHAVHYPTHAPLRQPPTVFENLQGRSFRRIAAPPAGYMAELHEGRGAAAGDIDADGDVDLTVSRINDPVVVLSNETATDFHWFSLRLIGVASNRTAVGSVVHVSTSAGTQMRQLKGGASYASTNDSRLHFGLGDATTIDKLTIRWSNGATQEITGLAVDRLHTLVEPVRE